MGRYILRRILYAIPIAFGVSVVCFSLVYIAPGDPLQTVMPPDATAETIAIVKHAYGFDRPLPMQFLIWLGRVVTGDFGVSIATRRPVFLEVSEALANTALLAMFAVPLAFFTGYVMGAVAGSFAGRWIDRVVTGAAVVVAVVAPPGDVGHDRQQVARTTPQAAQPPVLLVAEAIGVLP